MNVPINSFKLFGMELDIYKHAHNPTEQEHLESYYLDGYLELVVTITEEHDFINPNEFRVLIVSPIDGRQLFDSEGRVFVLTLAPFEKFVGVHCSVNHAFKIPHGEGADLIEIITKTLTVAERHEILVIRHNKGLVIPSSMILN